MLMVVQGHGNEGKEPGTREYLFASVCPALALASWEAMGLLLHNLEVGSFF